MKRMPTEKHVLEYFFTASLEGGWVSGAQAIPNPSNPNWDLLTHQQGSLSFVDTWHTQGTDYSTGYTMIRSDDIPVWVMHYGGRYRKEAIATLKAALKTAYEKGEFRGGRGPREFQLNNHIYSNNAHVLSFTEFWGRETMYTTENILGEHRYFGYWLAGR